MARRGFFGFTAGMRSLGDYYGGRSFPELARTIVFLRSRGMNACVSILPRLRLSRSGIRDESRKYLALLDALAEHGLQADLTVKLSQLGERWAFDDCVSALERIVEGCRRAGSFLWVDMEQSSLVDPTIEAFEAVARGHGNVGLCLQTYLRRTPRDLERLLERGYPLRLVKGYYRERPPASFDTWRKTTDCFARLIPALLAGSRRPAIGTHDPWLVEQAERALSRTAAPAGRPRGDSSPLEFQLFLGAKPGLAERLVEKGHPVRIYIPYGALIPYLLHSLPHMDLSRNLQRVLGFETIR